MSNIVQIRRKGSPIMAASAGIFAANYGNMIPQFEQIRKILIEEAEKRLPEAIEFRDAVLMNKELPAVTKGSIYEIRKGVQLNPIIIGFVSDPPSYEWYLDVPKEAKEGWKISKVYAIPSKHKFLDSNLLPGKGFIVPMEMVLRPVDLLEDRFFFSWYGGFVVADNSNNAPKSK